MIRYTYNLLKDCTFLCSVEVDGIKVDYYEHPEFGDETFALAVIDETLFSSGFYDPFNECDTQYVIESFNDDIDTAKIKTSWEKYNG